MKIVHLHDQERARVAHVLRELADTVEANAHCTPTGVIAVVMSSDSTTEEIVMGSNVTLLLGAIEVLKISIGKQIE